MPSVKDLHKFSKELNVLYVEDDDNLREETQTLLSTLFQSITTAVDGEHGLKEYNENFYDLVISDVNMPRMNGIEMCKNIKEINPEQKILIVSAHDESETLMSLIKTGASGFILKPMTLDNLVISLYPVCRDAQTQKVNIQLVHELNEKNRLLEKQNHELRALSNTIETKHFQLAQVLQECEPEEEKKLLEKETLQESTNNEESPLPSTDNALLNDYFKNDTDEGEENILLLSEHCEDLSEIFSDIPEIIARYIDHPSEHEIELITKNLSKAASVLVFYTPYLDIIASSFSELATAMTENTDEFIELMRIDPQSVLMLFDAVSSDIERYIERFSVESLAMKNIHHIHEPTALSIQQIITLFVPQEENEVETDDIFDF